MLVKLLSTPFPPCKINRQILANGSLISTGLEKGSCKCLFSSEGSSHLLSSHGLSSWDHSCRFRCLPGKLRVQSTGPCRRPWGFHILARPTLQSSGTLPGHTPLGPSMLGPGNPLKGFKRDNVWHTVHLLLLSFAGNLVFLYESE